MIYSKQIKINYFDCDINNVLKLSSAMRLMQQTSSEQMEVLGFSPEKLYGENMVFLLSKTCLKVHRMPQCTEQVEISTAPIQTQGVRFFREFTMDSRDGERLLSALTLWVLVDPHSHKIIRPNKFPYSLEFEQSMLRGAIGDQSVPKAPEQHEGQTVMQIPIRYSHLDLNRHVNNAVYGDFVCDALPYDKLVAQGLDTFILNFKSEARPGEVLDIVTTPLSQNEYHIIGRRDSGICFDAYVGLRQN
jgi:acyl-ACP thioesterase